MTFRADHNRLILGAALILALVSAGCATPQARPFTDTPRQPSAPVRAEQGPAEKTLEARVEDAAPSPDVKAAEPAPVQDEKAEEPAPAPDVKAAEPAPVPDAKATEPAPVQDEKAEEPAPAPDVKAEEPAPVHDAKAEEPVPAPDVKAEEPAPAPHAKTEQVVPAPDAKVHAAAPAHPRKEVIRPRAAAPQPPAETKKEPARPAPVPASPAPAAAAQQRDKTDQRPGKRGYEREQEVVSLPEGRLHRTLAERNDERLLYVFTGMYRSTVQEIMGERYYYKREYWKDPDRNVVEVLFYLTREPKKGMPVTERHLTPVLIKDARVSAMGKYRLKKLRRVGERTSAPITAVR